MSDQSPILALPLIQPAQAQKHVTHNEALMRLDLLVQLAVDSRSQTTPPASPAEGLRHIVPAGATGDWAGKTGQIALWLDAVWQFTAPLPGWRAWVADEEAVVTFSAGQWRAMAEGALTVAELGVSASPDATNRLAVSSSASLFNHAGAGHQVKLNKAAAGDTASLLFQTGFSGRAEMGTAGSDDFAIKVSGDGGSFATALTIGAASAEVTLARPALLTGQSADPVTPVDGLLWHHGPTGDLRFRSAGETQILNAQQEVPWLVPDPGEFVMTTICGTGATSVLTGVANRTEIFPFMPRKDLMVDALGLNCATAVAAAQAKLVVYGSNALGRPDALLAETGVVDLSTTGNKTAAASLVLRRGLTYWLGLRHSATATISAWAAQSTPDINGGTTMLTTSRKVLRRTLAFATPAQTVWGFDSTEIAAANPPAIWLRMA